MKTACPWQVGSATDAGLERGVNEDRLLVDESRGIFLVVDGLGGHAAGEMAAETAVQVISESLVLDGDLEERIRSSITEANNRICRLARNNPNWYGMACVLTLAVARDGRVTVGHVGDSRLYLAWNSTLRKLTSDHSPVGEQEEQGEIDEQDAMRHPRRNEVFRDVGSQMREPGDPDFIQTKTFLFREDAALLLCSDGLSDSLTSAEINAIIERYEGDPTVTARELVEAANAAGGRDNISVVLVAGPEFLGGESTKLLEARPRHATTRMRNQRTPWSVIINRALWLIAGVILGILLWAVVDPVVNWYRPPARQMDRPVPPKHITADAADSLGIIKALAGAQPGDTVDVPPGRYLGPVQMKDHVSLVSAFPGQAMILSDPSATAEPGIAVVAKGLSSGLLRGVRIASDQTHPLRTGILLQDSTIDVEDTGISGAVDAAIRVEGKSRPGLLANFIHENSGTGVLLGAGTAARLVGNRISDNGMGIEIEPSATPVLENNSVLHNGLK
ncbi:MAG TPA: protein phosphatase 2C domain-containing protein [Bryobacteraceae bacterium]|nr:protein phosphatase 2C domain-containing protein [Bryobacteraceae bacterium]